MIEENRSFKNMSQLAKHLAYVALQILSENDGNMPLSELLAELERREGTAIPSELRETQHNNQRYLKWQVRMMYAAIPYASQGYLRKGGGTWYITKKGRRALLEKSEEKIISEVTGFAREYKRLGKHLAYVMLQILLENEGRMLLSELETELERKEGDLILSEFKQIYDADKWLESMISSSKEYVRLGYLRKDKGTWYITVEGEKALSERREIQIDDTAEGDTDEIDDTTEMDSIDKMESNARTNIERYIHSINPYEFQNLCAALIRGMGYYVRSISSPGADGGIDIIAYTDLLGAKSSRIKVQVKHYTSGIKISPADVRALAGVLDGGDIGVFMTSSVYTKQAEKEAHTNSEHVELIDLNRFINLWIDCYDKLSKEDQSLLPLQPVYFLNRGES